MTAAKRFHLILSPDSPWGPPGMNAVWFHDQSLVKLLHAAKQLQTSIKYGGAGRSICSTLTCVRHRHDA